MKLTFVLPLWCQCTLGDTVLWVPGRETQLPGGCYCPPGAGAPGLKGSVLSAAQWPRKITPVRGFFNFPASPQCYQAANHFFLCFTQLNNTAKGHVTGVCQVPALISQVLGAWGRLGGAGGGCGGGGFDGRVIASNSNAFNNGYFSQASEETKMGNNSCLLDF